MKIKKLITLLAVASMIAACGPKKGGNSSSSNQPASDSSVSAPASSDEGSNDSSAPAPSSSDVPTPSSSDQPASSSQAPAPSSSQTPAPSSSAQPASSSQAPAPSSSAQPASSSQAPASSSSQAPAPSSSAQPSSSSQAPAPTLASISVTAPTKVDYTTADTALDLTGMVVTANFSDGSTQPVDAGYTVSDPDFSVVGKQDITVTYEGLTDTFEINVTQAKPTAWSAAEKANFEAACYGFVPSFFYGPDYGVGEIAWTLTAGNVLFGEGGNIDAPEAGADYPFKGIADSLVSDGFTITTKPGDTDTTYHYSLLKAVTNENVTRYVRARLAATNSQGSFVASGAFYIDFSDPYYYTWAETGWGAALKQAFGADIDFPTLPDGLYEKDFARILSLYIQYEGHCPIEVVGLGANFDPAPILANFENDNWEYAPASLASEDYDYVAASKDGKFIIGIALDRTNGKASFDFQYAPDATDLDSSVAIVAKEMGLKPFAFEVSSTAASYYFATSFNDGETLPQLRDRYAELLTGDDGDVKFTRASYSDAEKDVRGDYVFEAPEESNLPNIRVTLYADKLTSGAPYIGVVVRNYIPFSEDIKNYATVLGFDPFNLKVDSSSGEYFIDIDINEELSVDQMLAYYTGLLDADAALAEPVVGAVQVANVTGQVDEEGIGSKYLSYANDSTLVIIYAAVKKDAKTGAISRLVELIFQDYNPAPESEWVNALSAALGGELTWQNDEGCFYLGGAIAASMPDGQSYQSIASIYANTLLNADDELEPLSATSGSSYYIIKLFGPEGYVEIQCYQNKSTDPVRIAIMVYLFAHPEYDAFVNGISAAMGVELAELAEGVYGAQTTNVNDGLSLAQYGQTIALGYSEGKSLLAASGLQFSFDASQSGFVDDENPNNYCATFVNPNGYTVELWLLGNSNKLFTGTILIYVYLPAENSGE